MIAIIPGSYDPFTKGHREIVEKAVRMFDKVYVVIEYNDKKERMTDTLEMANAISKLNLGCEVCIWNGLTIDIAKKLGADVIVRGIRDINDYMYEEKISSVNDMIGGENLDYVWIRGKNNISSSLVKEMIKYGADIKQWVDEEIVEVL